MARVNLNSSEIIEKVYQRYQDRTLQPNEQGVSFPLGYYFSKNSQLTIGFEVGLFGSAKASFSPDLDVLVTDDEIVGYEVKGYRSDNRRTTRSQLYKGLGQAVTLVNQPSVADGGALDKVAMVYFEKAEFDKSNWRWKQDFINSIQGIPVGLITVGTDKAHTVVESSSNPSYNPAIHSNILTTLREQTTGLDRRHPEQDLPNLALEIEKTAK